MSVITPSGTKADGQRQRRARRSVIPQNATPAGGAGRRGMSADLFQRVALLPPRDRAIIELTLTAKLSRGRIARALGMAGGQVSRRVRALYARLHDPLVIALFDERCPLAPEYRQLGIEHFLLAQPAERLADKHRMSPMQVRRILTFIRGWHNGTLTAPRR